MHTYIVCCTRAAAAAAGQGVKKSVVASTSTRLINRLPAQASAVEADSQSDQQGSQQEEEPSTAPQADSDAKEEECTAWQKTPDTNVKLNQPLRCGRYGQDLISLKDRQKHGSQTEADRGQGQKPRVGAGGKLDPALIASRQSTTAAVVAPTKAAPVSVAEQPATTPATQMILPRPVPAVAANAQEQDTIHAATTAPRGAAAARAFARDPASTRAASRGLAPEGPAVSSAVPSVDDLLTGRTPVAPIMTASMAGEAAAMAASVAALAKTTAAEREAARAALGQHYRQYRAKKAAAEQRNAIPSNRPQGKALQPTAAPAPDLPINQGSEAGPSGHHHTAGPNLRQHRSDSHAASGAAVHDIDTEDDVPLRVKYGTSSSGSSSRASWQVSAVRVGQSQDTAMSSMHLQERQPQQQLVHGSKHPRPAKKSSRHVELVHGGTAPLQMDHRSEPLRHNVVGSSLVESRELHSRRPAAGSGSATQNAAPEEVGLQFDGEAQQQAVNVRKSNDKLDMLLQSTVKRTQQGVLGKENQVRKSSLVVLHVLCQMEPCYWTGPLKSNSCMMVTMLVRFPYFT